MHINEQQKNSLLSYLKEFLAKPLVINDGVEEDYNIFDERRLSSIPNLQNLITLFLNSEIDLKKFKEESELACRRFSYWGFKSFSGQMQLNQYSNNIDDINKEIILKEAITVPVSEEDAVKKINKLADYLSNLKEKTDNPKSIPRISQYYLLSYFWEIQNHSNWPVYYGSTKKILTKLGFNLDGLDSYGEEYIEFLKIIKEIQKLYEKEASIKEKSPYWFIEHVLWSQFIKTDSQSQEIVTQQKSKKATNTTTNIGDWIPDIVKDLNELSFNSETAWTKKMGLKPEKAFETKLRYAFTLLGFEVQELGQGTGREPDGVAISKGVSDGDYAIVYDAKAREGSFSIGTSDREIYEYIQKKKEELRRKRINKIYFLIVSSDFHESNNLGLIREIYKKTQVPITLLRASDLLFIIDTKLQEVDIDHIRLEDLFLDTGLITREKIVDRLGLR